ncbi:MAG: hypothetical protein L0332_28610, partial [Chloroflexi bacterium]|nr:hypothetical protein [Nitrososphaera sp.]MCI0645522.1 hypothetical protein [Chloroflexota bacterium]MCI0730661.1 hypothetical protein [Chloroflexota bacterium]
FNRYTYSANNPLKYVDPTGHCAQNVAADLDCWKLLWGLEQDWGIDIQDEFLWLLEYLQTLQYTLEQYGNYVGGADIFKSILAESARSVGRDQFIVRGSLLGSSDRCTTGCARGGQVAFDLTETFAYDPDSASARAVGALNEPGEFNAARIIMAHEFAHIIDRLEFTSVWEYYSSQRDWTYYDSLSAYNWRSDVRTVYQYEDPRHHMIALMGYYVAGGNSWGLVGPNAQFGQLSPLDKSVIVNIGSVINSQARLWNATRWIAGSF